MEGIRIIVLLDMPQATRHERKVAREMREYLFALGFAVLQEGVCTRVVDGYSSAGALKCRLREKAPESGTVRLLVMTEAQYQSSELLAGEENAQEAEVGSQQDIFL